MTTQEDINKSTQASSILIKMLGSNPSLHIQKR